MGQISRRQFLQYAAAGAAAAGLGSKNARRLISPAEPVPNEVAGEPTIYATTCRECPAGCGMHVWNREGRAVKAEGSPEHPISRGGLCARGQSSLQGLYDPDRIKTPLRRGDDGKLVPSDWASALAAIAARLAPKRGRVVLLSDLQTGTLDELMRAFCSTIGAAAPLYYEPVNYPALSRAYGVLGHEGVPRFVLDDCRLVVSFAADFLETWVSPVEFTRGFARTRDWKDGGAGRFLYVGPWQSMTAANADEFWQVPPAALPHVAFSLLHEVLQGGHARQDAAGIAELARPYDLAGAAVRAGIAPQKLRRVAELFCQEAPTLALAGPAMADDAASRDAAVAAALLNYAAGRVGQTVRLDRPHALGKAAGRKQVAAAIQSLGPDDVLIVHQANPVYSLGGPKDAALRAGLVVYLGTMADETAHQANWVLPVDSPLESWGDYEPYSGIHCLLQPVTGRLYDTRPAGDVLLDLAARAGKPLARAAGQAPGSFQEWQRQRLGPVLTENKQAERLGFAQAAAPATRAQLQPPAQRAGAAIPPTIQPPASLPAGQAELWVYPSIMLFDGRLANRGWLQEAPDPVSYIVWNSWLDIHPRKALSLGLAAGDVVEVRNDVGVIELPIRLNEEQVEDVVSVGLGQGHTALGRFADGVGANAFSLLSRVEGSPPESFAPVRATIRRTGRKAVAVMATATMNQFGRDILHWTTPAALAAGQAASELILPLPEGYIKSRDLYPPRPYKEHRWAMVVDLQRCVGCGACGVACYAENNLPVVGAVKAAQGRLMAWLQVLPYRHDEEAGRRAWLPLLCQQCDAAPCESVCPVFAAVHNEEGLNAQVYNRCVGTRYCNNNCPYKVRRFNWSNTEWANPLEKQLNPEVSVRSRGVMEKCTFCIQRIHAVERRAKLANRPVRDGEIQPACVQSCPARVYTFGDLLDEKAEVTRLIRAEPRRYQVLKELNTKPAVIYLKRIRMGVTA